LEEPVTRASALDRGRESFARQAWGDAYTQLSATDRKGPLGLDDMERLAVAAYLAGRDDASEDSWTRVHQESVRLADWGRAARCAFWLGITLMNRSERAKGGGWLARAQRVLEDSQHACVERGWLLIPLGLRRYADGDFAGSRDAFRQAGEIGASYRDRDLVPMALQAEGRALLRMGKTAEGVALLDEAMVAVAAGEVSPIPAGIIYCSVIEACHEILDIRRAQEWTAALSEWCAAQPDLVPYRGRCLVHRAEILQLHGEWPEALEEARRACERLAQPLQPQLGAAYYQKAELHRLRGEFGKAEEAYREASQRGRAPEPGLAQLRLAQGRVDTAAAAIGRALDEARDPVARSKVLPACVQIMLASGDVQAARAAADELAAIAADRGAPLLRGVAAQALGAVFLAEGDARAALDALRSARSAWGELEVPYEAALVQVLVGIACRELGDDDTARMELDAASDVLLQLGAAPDVERLERLRDWAKPKAAGGLTAREVQVLRLVAAGRSNREIAAELVISDRTVARHMSNIFHKLNVSSRTAAAAFAFEHALV
jgi:DNA-binding CsgD family transcriptional regulator